jgi:hypothetical protein
MPKGESSIFDWDLKARLVEAPLVNYRNSESSELAALSTPRRMAEGEGFEPPSPFRG